MTKNMKYFQFLALTVLLIFPQRGLSQNDVNHYPNIAELFPSLQKGKIERILIVPTMSTQNEKVFLRGSGVGYLSSEEAGAVIEQIKLKLGPAKTLRAPQWYHIYFLFRDKPYSASEVLTCQVEGENVNLVEKGVGYEAYFSLSETLSKLISRSIVRDVLKTIDPSRKK